MDCPPCPPRSRPWLTTARQTRNLPHNRVVCLRVGRLCRRVFGCNCTPIQETSPKSFEAYYSRLLDVSSGFEGVPGGMIVSPSVLVNGDGGTDDACGRCAFIGAWGEASVEAGRTTAGYRHAARPGHKSGDFMTTEPNGAVDPACPERAAIDGFFKEFSGKIFREISARIAPVDGTVLRPKASKNGSGRSFSDPFPQPWQGCRHGLPRGFKFPCFPA